MQNSNVTAEYTLKFEQVRVLLLERLRIHSSILQGLIDNGLTSIPTTTPLPTYVGYGVCYLFEQFSADYINRSLPREYQLVCEIRDNLSETFHLSFRGTSYPIDVVSEMAPGDQYWSFSGCIQDLQYSGLTVENFNLYAAARIELIGRVIKEVSSD